MIEKKLWSSDELNSRLKNVNYSNNKNATFYTRLEPRTRNADFKKALSFEVYDPLWMLTRQWQFGRFKAVDCGSPVMIKVKTIKGRITSIQRMNKSGQFVFDSYSTDKPMEYEVEKQNVQITPYVRVESAMQLKKMLLATKKIQKSDFAFLYKEFKLDDIRESLDENDINSLKTKNNQALAEFYKFYLNRSFDGYKVYKDFETINIGKIEKLYSFLPDISIRKIFIDVLVKYVKWFANKFLPCSKNTNYWNDRKLGYDVKIGQGSNLFVAEDYDSGTLSWHSFDYSGQNSSAELQRTEDPKFLSYIPSPSQVPGAPASRLWEFENRKVNMGNGDNDCSSIGSAAIMQYVTMFSNDWMFAPLETETGCVLDVQGIIVKDSFGDRFYINKNAQQLDEENYNKSKKYDDPPYEQVIYTDRWNLFGSCFDDAYKINRFSTAQGLLFPPAVLRNEESKPVEEVQFLRDEMANMVWGVETVINNGCGGTMDGKTLSDLVFSDVDASNQAGANEQNSNKQDKTDDDKAIEYSLLIQNRVPMNWIPFVPEQVKRSEGGNCSDIEFRRGRMPVYFNKSYQWFAPSTDLLGYKFTGDKVNPMYINEEELASCGIKIVKTAQRTRWFLGKSFNWVGNKQVINEYQANSGLMFDELISKATGKAIKLKPQNQEQTQEETAPEK